MKHLYLLLAGVCASAFVTAQFSGNFAYGLSVPQQEMADNIKPLHSLKVNIMRQLPGALNRVSLGVDLGLGTYAQLRREQTFVFTDGSTTRTMVNYSSNVFSAGLGSRIDLLQKGNVIPYLKGGAGYTLFYSNLSVENPNDVDGCQPLERESIIKDHTLYTTYGAGVKIDSRVFCKSEQGGKEWIDFSVSRVQGGTLDYINTKHLQDHYHTTTPVVDGKSRPLVQRFINVNSNIIHEHQVAEVYTSPLRMLEFRIGYTVRF